ncbi:expressed unknown protein [Seminavis robusta]|uniref:Uncharacterized protein n=1 Tax=Seminavis robusta TaxID=568900 RepID=A0A9N8HSL1_9STRA|nr:expressed unknown protein [Seminavis robusta]|eukprot:Sro1399_g269330.1 n/a (486) ;mRNA; r:1635-3092
MVTINNNSNNKKISRGSLLRLMLVLLAVTLVLITLLLLDRGRQDGITGNLDGLSVRRYDVKQDINSGGVALLYSKPKRRFQKNRFTLDDFVVNGVNLARYGFESEDEQEDTNQKKAIIHLTSKYNLFDNFDIGDQIQGDEGWWDLVHYHRDLRHKSLIFYMDKVAQKRYMKHVGYPIPKAFSLQYQKELVSNRRLQQNSHHHHHPSHQSQQEEITSVRKLLPPRTSYVVKPTHMSSSSGVWLVRYDPQSQKQSMGYSGKPTSDKFDEKSIAQRVVQDLHDTAADFESWALKHAQPGFVVEERYSGAWDDSNDDSKAAYEFKTFTIWGRVYISYLKRGSGPYVGLAYRNGTMVDCANTNANWTTIPEWLQYDKIVALAEQLGKNKDMFRADIFVGIPASEVGNGNSNKQLRIVVSETEFHPTSAFHDQEILEEAARLWMAGYKMNIYNMAPNTEVPAAFLKKGYLSERDAQKLQPIPEAVALNSDM